MASPRTYQFAIFDVNTGAPLPGQTPSFVTYCDETGLDITPPVIHEIKGGLYYFIPTFRSNHALAAMIDLGAGSLSRYWIVNERPEDYDVDLISGISTNAGTAASQATIARKHLQNTKKVDSGTNREVVYDDDQTTPFDQYDLKDSAGTPTTGPNIFQKVKV